MQEDRGRFVFVSSLRGYGGGERWMLDAAHGLSERGYEAIVVSRPGSALSYKAPPLGVRWESVEMRGDADPLAILRLARLFRRVKPTVVCPNLDREIRLCAAAIRLAGVLPGGGRTRLIPRRGSEFPLKNKLHYRHVYQHEVDHVIVNSRATKRTMVSKTPWFPVEKIKVIYNGIDPSVFNALLERRDELRHKLREEIGVSDGTAVVVLVGELSERKGQHHIVKAAPSILERFPDAHFLFVGDGEAREGIERAIERGDRKPYFTLAGFRDDVEEILVGSDVLVLPSSVEGFGYALVEGMAAGLPIVASNTSSIPEIVEEGVTGYLHSVGDAEVLAGHVCALLGTPERARRMGHRGRAAVANRFHIGRMLDELERLFADDVAHVP
jgi:glycosyltransferase involved in cell wall biosynthesis